MEKRTEQLSAVLEAAKLAGRVCLDIEFKNTGVGMLGMTDIYSMVSALEAALHDGTPVDDLFIELEQSRGSMCDQAHKTLTGCK